ncbi:hypothetical protein FACS189437_07200 [Bacteroidia bacterium]|nr:hypothetical protein FACS189437_07200 [Bacteroidia bacterium]
MKKMDFLQMENLQGGQTATTVADDDFSQVDSKGCFGKGAAFLGSAILSLGTTGFTAGLSWGLTVYAYVDYMDCKLKQIV